MKWKRLLFSLAGVAAICATILAVRVIARDNTPEEIILNSIEANLTAIGSLTAEVACDCSNGSLSFEDGFLYLKGSEKIAIWRGASNSQVWCNGTCFNVADPIDNVVYGYLWNDTSGDQTLFWALKVGYTDPRVAYGAANQQRGYLQLATGTEVVNGVTCYKLSGTGLRLWVDTNNTARVIRCEADYDDLHDDKLVARADYTGWTTVGGAQVPTELALEVFDGNGGSLRWFEFSLSNVQVGATVDDGLFDIWVPPDTSMLN